MDEFITLKDLSTELKSTLNITDPLEINVFDMRLRGICDYAYRYTQRTKIYKDNIITSNNLQIEISKDNIKDNIVEFIYSIWGRDKGLLTGYKKEVSELKDGNSSIKYNVNQSLSSTAVLSSVFYKELEQRLNPYRVIKFSILEV